MKNTIIFKGIISVLLLCTILSFSGCGKKTLTYTEYTERGITYEVPSEMLEDSVFTVAVNEDLTEDIHDYFFETYILDMYSSQNLDMDDIKNIGSYKVYIYKGSSVIEGKSVPLNVVGIGYNNAVYMFVFVWSDDYIEERENIYSRFLDSLK